MDIRRSLTGTGKTPTVHPDQLDREIGSLDENIPIGNLQGTAVHKAIPNLKPTVDEKKFASSESSAQEHKIELEPMELQFVSSEKATEYNQLQALRERIEDHKAAATNLNAQLLIEEAKPGNEAVSKCLKSAIDCHRQAAAQLEKAIALPKDAPEAATWKEAAGQNEKAAEYYVKAAEVFRNNIIGSKLTDKSIAKACQQAAEYLIQSLEDPTHAEAFKKAASYRELQVKYLIDEYTVSRDQTTANNLLRDYDQEKYFHNIESLHHDLATSADEASQAVIKSIEDPTHAETWEKIAENNKKAIGFDHEAVAFQKHYISTQSPKEKTLLNKKYNIYHTLSAHLKLTANYLKTSIKDPTHAETWKEAAEWQQKQVDYQLQVMEREEQKLPVYSYQQLARLSAEMASYTANKATILKNDKSLITNEIYMKECQTSINHHLAEIAKLSQTGVSS